MLHHALHPKMMEKERSKALAASPPGSNPPGPTSKSMSRQHSGMAPPSRRPDAMFTSDSLHLKDLSPKARRACEICISSAKYSTTAFDGVQKKGRVIVTNIFGTSHA